jgi:hypothetical protein
MLAGQADQPVAELFFRTYSGSGLVIHCLARFQRIPNRSCVAACDLITDKVFGQAFRQADFCHQFQGPQAGVFAILVGTFMQ